MNLLSKLLSDRPEGRAGGEEEGADVGARHPQHSRGGRGDAGLTQALLLKQSYVTKPPCSTTTPLVVVTLIQTIGVVASVTPLDHQ